MAQQSAIYNHRPLQPTGAVLPQQPAPQPAGAGGPSAISGPPGASASASASRLSELLDIVRQEFDSVNNECSQLRNQRDEYEGRVGGQINELTAIRNALYDLENQHAKIRQQYESEVASLKAELAALAASQQAAAAQQPPPPSHPPPPSSHLPPHSGLPSYPPPDPYYKGRGGGPPHPPLAPDAMEIDERDARERDRDLRERERERERERDRDLRDREMRERDRDRDRRDLSTKKGQLPPNAKGVDREPGPPRPASSAQMRAPTQVTPKLAPGNAPAPPPPSTSPYISSRERDRGDRNDRDQRDRERDNRERMMMADRDDHLPPSHAPPPQSSTGNTPHPYGPPAQQPPPSASSTGSAPVVHGPPPPPGHSASYRDRGDRDRDEEKYHPNEEPNGGAPPPSASGSAAGALVSAGSSSSVSSGLTMAQLMDMDPEHVPSEHKKNGSDWYAIFNPQVKRVLDINLVMSLSHESVVCCVRFSTDGKFLATGCNRTAQIYDTKTGAKTCVLADENTPSKGDLYIRSVCFSPDGKLLATGAEDKKVRIWDIAKRKIKQIFDGHTQEIYSLDFSRDGRKIVSGSGDKTARIWDMENGEHTLLSILEPDSVDAGVTSVAISSDGRHVAAGSLDTIVRIWDVATGKLIERLRGHQDSVYSVAFTPDGKGLVSGSLDKSLKYWNLEPLIRNPDRLRPLTQGGSIPSGQQPVTKEGGEKGSNCTVGFSGHKDYVLSVAVSPDGAYVVSGSKDRGVQFWDPKSSQTQLMLQGHKNSVISIDLSPAPTFPGGGLLATGSGDWHARVWSYGPLQ